MNKLNNIPNNIFLCEDPQEGKIPNNVIINEMVISKFGNKIKITPVKLFNEKNFDISHVKTVTLGNKMLDSVLLTELYEPEFSYERIFDMKNLIFL